MQATGYMERALELGWSALGSTSPNPAVGCVIVRNGVIVGEGWTHPPGQQHAEAAALEQAASQARGASLYTTLEPCNHYGRTPPCAEAIIAAGIAEVHIALTDPNPNVAGGGIAHLEAAGIATHLYEPLDSAKRLIEAFTKHCATKLPFVTAKFAMSLDGKIASRSGDSKWISGDESRRFAHLLRSQSDAIMVGINTVLADNPMLTARNANGNPNPRQPLRIVLDSSGRMPSDANMLTAPGRTLIATASASHNRMPHGIQTLRMPAADGSVDLCALLTSLGESGITSILAEGGGAVLGSLFDLNLVDKVVAFVSPVIIGGSLATSPVEGAGVASMNDALRLRDADVRRFGEDVAIIGYCRGNKDVHRHS